MECPIIPSRVRNSSQGTILSYELPRRTYTATIHPIESPNGSTVILFGHETGVEIVWRGGRHFKPSQQKEAEPSIENGISEPILLIDSDDESPSADFEDKPEFIDEDEDYNFSVPYPHILQTLELSLGAGVLHVAVLPSSIIKSDEFDLGKVIIFVAACSDLPLRLVTLPLTPPSPASKSRLEFQTAFTSANAGNGKWGEKIITLNGHNRPSDGVSMIIDSSNDDPHYIIASHSREVNGRLLLWRSPLRSHLSHIEPFQSIYLTSPAKSISFNPSSSKPNYLLVAETTGACRIFDYNAPKILAGLLDPLSAAQGNWLISLFTGFKSTQTDTLLNGAHIGFGRKTILDAQWISNGCAIIVLLEDGEWGIWDIKCSSPVASRGLISRQGIKGGSISKYSLSGFIQSTNKAHKTGPPQMIASKFAPMTPGTRKSIDPFGNSSSGPTLGQISVIKMPGSSSTLRTDEAVLFRFGQTYALMPSVTKFTATHAGKNYSGGLFSGDSSARIIHLKDIDLQGEQCSAVVLIPSYRGPSSGAPLPDVLILGEHRSVIFNSARCSAQPAVGRPLLIESAVNGLNAMHTMELDVAGIEMALEQMGEKSGTGLKKKVLMS